MPSNGTTTWELRSLHGLARYLNGRPTKPAEVVSSGVPVIKIAELNRGVTAATDHVASEAVAEKHWVGPGDLLFAWSGTVGIHVYDGPPAALNQHIFRVVPNEDVDGRFLRYLLEAQIPRFGELVADKRTTMGHVTVADLRRYQVPVPPHAEQRRIGLTLHAIDAKIESNRRLLRALSQATATLFEHRVLTGSASAGDLTSIARFVNGRNFTKDATDHGRPIIRIKELKAGVSSQTLRSGSQAKDEHLAAHHDLLFAWSGSLGVHRWHGPESLINQHIFKVVPLPGYPGWFVEGWLRHHLAEFKRIAQDKATTMGHIKREHLEQAAVLLPAEAELSALDAALAPLDMQAATLARESYTLTQVRADLLPKLVSGALHIDAAHVHDQSLPDNEFRS